MLVLGGGLRPSPSSCHIGRRPITSEAARTFSQSRTARRRTWIGLVCVRSINIHEWWVANPVAPSSVRNVPETFCFTLTIRKSLSAKLLSNGTARSPRKPSTSSLRFMSRRSNKLRVKVRPQGFPPDPCELSDHNGYAEPPEGPNFLKLHSRRGVLPL